MSEYVASRTTVLMYAHPTMQNLASAIVRICSESCTNGRRSESCDPITPRSYSALSSKSKAPENSRKVIFREDIQWNKFNDGFPKIFIENVRDVAGRDLIFIASFHTPEMIFEQLSVLYAIPRYLARSVIVILPYFPTGTMERVDKEGQIATAKTLATLLSEIPLTARGPTQIMLFDIHALQERFYFSDRVIPRLESAVPLLLRKLNDMDSKNVSIAFPDDGAMKRFGDMFSEYHIIICTKVRNGDKRNVRVKDGDPADQHVIIVDDLVQTGGTLMECAKACMEKGAVKISCFVTHAVFPNESWKKFATESHPEVSFEKFWITDSLPHSREIGEHQPFEVLSLADVIADRLLGYDLVPSL